MEKWKQIGLPNSLLKRLEELKKEMRAKSYREMFERLILIRKEKLKSRLEDKETKNKMLKSILEQNKVIAKAIMQIQSKIK